MPRDRAAKIWTRGAALGGTILLAAYLAGCAAIGPQTVARDRFDYVSALSESWKSQTLLNLVKTRYLDTPVFLDVGSVINQYSLEQEVGLGVSGELYNKGAPSFVGPEIGLRGRYTDRPTITYNPLMGENFARSLLKPIPNTAILLLVEAGYPIDYVLRICIQAINGIENHRSGGLARRRADPNFYELLTLLRRIQDRKTIILRSKSMEGRETLSIYFRPPKDVPSADLEKATRLLGLDADAREFQVVSGSLAAGNREIAVLGRSMAQIFSEYASYIEVPEDHIAEGRVIAAEPDHAAKEAGYPPLIRVRNGTSIPDDAFVAVSYRKHWFWIDDRDVHSKGMLHFLMVLFSFTERGDIRQTSPILTVPTN